MIIVRLQGGLGNQMFQYAYGYALAHQNQVELLLDVGLLRGDSRNKLAVKRSFELHHFGVQNVFVTHQIMRKFSVSANASMYDKIFHRIYRASGKYKMVVQHEQDFDKSHLRLRHDEMCLAGRWQSEMYFQSVRDDIRSIFSPAKLRPHPSAEVMLDDFKTSVSVAVHVRRTDYKKHSVYSEKIGALSKGYYDESMQLVMSKLKSDAENVRFYFVSDDIAWCRLNWEELPNVAFVELPAHENAHISDFWLLTQADHCIISNSTFAWWGAYLGSKSRIVVAPANWAKSQDYTPEKILRKDWLNIDNTFED